MGELRFARPVPPQKNATLQDGSYGNQCPNAQVDGFNLFGGLSELKIATEASEALSKVADVFENEKGDEDCLFLDIYVPGDAVRKPNATKLPVMHWFFGGGFVFGGKDYVKGIMPFYDGSGMLEVADNKVIWVASNYRLGAFGWLAGATMEEQGAPNAGLWDQRMALQWVKDNIGQLGGNGDDITAYGLSAGASSLLHHLVLEGGTMDPLFKKAIFLSAAYQPFLDRRGSLDGVFRNFTRIAGCNESTVACLRSLDSDTLIQANQALMAQAPSGTFLVGPSPDGSLIRQTPMLEFDSGHYWKGLDGAIVSHVSDEATLFVDGHVRTDDELKSFTESLFPHYAVIEGLDQAVLDHYPSPSAPNSPYANEDARVRAIVRDSCFTCHARLLSEVYAGKTWNMQYSIFPGIHSSDLVPAFYNTAMEDTIVGDALDGFYPGLANISATYRSYFASLVLAGDPNTHADTRNNHPAVHWPHPDVSGSNVTGVLDVNIDNFALISDHQMPKDACQFWRDFYAAATIDGGYSPPGALLHTPLANQTAGASVNYSTPVKSTH